MSGENKEKNPINIRPIKSLLIEKFNIPRYQRGYRWGETQIIELLGDIYVYGTNAYGKDANKVGNFYCLQPIVVKRNEDKILWDLIDGQQRLTTIFIIIKYLQYLFPNTTIPLFTIDYETRNKDQSESKGKGCDFLNNIKFDTDKTPNTDNIDFYHMDMCSIYIKKWFSEPEHQGAEDIFKLILTSADQKNVSVIWYEVDTDADNNNQNIDNQIDVFKRLNIGKIPLTDSELIKAFLLQGDIYKQSNYIYQRLFEIAKEWDNIEYHLQKDEMWGFLNNKSYNPESRIDYLFKILAEDWNFDLEKKKLNVKENIEHFEYHVFEKYINMKREEKNDIETVADIFDEIKTLFSVLDEWYNDREMYHYIGFLVCQPENENKSVKIIKDLYRYFLGKHDKNGHSRPDCIKYIKLKIKDFISLGENQKLEILDYNNDSDKLKKILLFFNIESTIRLESENTHFPFHLYKEEVPSIEHIDPQTPEDKDYEQIKTWLISNESTLSSIIRNRIKSEDEIKECKDIQDEINKLLPLPYNEDFKKEYNILSKHIDALFNKLNNITPEDKEKTDTLSNYALIGKDTNSKLSNNSFKDKREIIINIIEGKETNKYIPVCTRNVFQKYYTEQPDNLLLWDIKDRTEYFKAMKNLYDGFFEKINTEADN
jgi:uncharacterized protein with ParB-like and HNH nuclease domain